jgi:hypothetical protein
VATVKVELGLERGPNDGWRRYTPIAHSFDTRANALSTEIQDDWEPQVQEQWRAIHAGIRESIIHEYGAADFEGKIDSFVDLGAAPWSVLGLHDVHLKQVRDAFVSKDYYPALVGASSLGERILNHLVLALRDDYSGHEATRHVAKQASIDDWKRCVKALSGWGVFDDETGRDYLALMRMRHGAIHYRSELDSGDAREAALEAVKLLCSLVERVFNSIGAGGHYFGGPIGRAYVRLDSESDPFVRKFILPACALVSPRYRFLPNTGTPSGLDAYDDPELGKGKTPLTDSEFAEPERATPQVAYPF